MIFFRAGLGWCKATILATTRDPGHLPSRPLIWKRMTSSLWASCVKLCPGDQADVDLSRRPVRGLAEPERGAQLPSPPLRTCYEALGRRPLSTLGCFDEGEASWQDHSNLKKNIRVPEPNILRRENEFCIILSSHVTFLWHQPNANNFPVRHG